MEIYKEVGRLIARIRKEKGLTQERLAELADLHPDYLGKIERGERRPTLITLQKLMHVFEMKLSHFFQMLEA